MNCWIEIDAAALRHNIRLFKNFIAPSTLLSVVKSNAYGHGLKDIASIFVEEGLPWLGVAYLDEAQILRDAGFKGNILIVAPVLSEEFERAATLGVDILMTHHGLLDQWLAAATKPHIHLKFDTGLSRQGFLLDQAAKVADLVEPHKSYVRGVCTHFANVEDVLEHQYADFQLQGFNTVKHLFKQRGFNLLAHCASSASSLILADSRFDLCRVGISTFGLWPSNATRLSFLQINSKMVDLKPVLAWKTKVFLIKEVKSGSYIGYGCTYRANHDMKVAALPLGYFEGYPRVAGADKSYVLIRGQRCPLLGRISMNIMMVDVTHVAGIQEGDEVSLIGRQQEEVISAEQLATWSHTINYELVACLNVNIPRKVINL